MTTLTPANSYDAVTQIELTDLLQGGPGGIDNVPHQQLLNRTTYLKGQTDAISAEITAILQALGNYQPLLGFTPVKQGAGVGQLANILSLGWSALGKILAQVDSSPMGALALESWVNATFAALAGDISKSFSASTLYAANGLVRPDGYPLFLQSGQDVAAVNLANSDYVPVLCKPSAIPQSAVTLQQFIANQSAGSGFMQLPDGTIVQRGSGVLRTGSLNMTLPQAFSSANYSVMVTDAASETWTPSNVSIYGVGSARSSTSFNVYGLTWTGGAWTYAGSAGFNYIAFGK